MSTPAIVPPLAHPIADPAKRRISQDFGSNPQDYAQFNMAGHNGIDFAVPMGTPIQAVDDGRVVQASFMEDYGNVIKLQHAWGESVYAHLSKFEVADRQIVKKGQKIALSGNTGNSTGPHLHFAMRINPYRRGAPYDGFSDPAPYLAATPTAPVPIPYAAILSLIKVAAANFGLDWRLVASLVWAESSFNPRAESGAGAKGLMQIMEPTWNEWSPRVGASDMFSPEHNVAVGCAYLAWLLRQTNGNVYKALHAYVWGIGNVLSNEPPPDEVVCYAAKIVHGRDLLKAVGA